jgi:hypothetical protein
VDWFAGAALGLFVHWDHASQQGLEVSWPLVGGIDVLPSSRPVPVTQYHSSIATFDPVHWEPAALADLAVRSGCGYAVLTAKHHSGFAMWPSAVAPEHGGWERAAHHWRPSQMEERIRAHQPDVICNDRYPGIHGYATPEQFVPATAPRGPWETCLTMNHAWGWVPEDTDYKSARRLIHTLAEVVGRGGNLLLNVSPMGDGTLPPVQRDRLETIASWMARHHEALHDVEPGLEPWQFHGPSTRRGGTVYLVCLARPYEEIVVRGVPIRRIDSVRVLGTGASLPFTVETGVIESFMPDPAGTVRIVITDDELDPVATVVALDVRA